MKELSLNNNGFFNNFNLSQLLIGLVILSFPFNYKIFLFLRAQDLFVLCFVFLNVKYIKIAEFKFLLILIFFIILSCLVGYFISGNFFYEKLAFIYKIIILQSSLFL